MRATSFETYGLFLALKNHFTRDSYDFFKYHGKTNASQDSFMARKDRFQFQKLARKVDREQLQDFIIANLIEGKSWVGDFLDDEAYDNFLAYMKRKQALSYTFANDLDKLFLHNPPETVFKPRSSSHPIILHSYISRDISPETFALLNHFLGFAQVFDKKLGDDYIWSKCRVIAVKLYPFIEYDKAKMLRTLKEKIHEYSREEQETGRASAPEVEEAQAG